MSAEEAIPVLLLTGTIGAGETTIAWEVHDALSEARMPHAVLDLDNLNWQWPRADRFNNELMFATLAAVWPVQRARGARRLVLARVLEDRAELSRYEEAVPGARITVCRLRTPEELRIARLRMREATEPARAWHLARTVELERVLEQGAVADVIVDNDGRAPREVATEVLELAGWA